MASPSKIHYLCKKCEVNTTNMGKHLRRERCDQQHKRKNKGAFK